MSLFSKINQSNKNIESGLPFGYYGKTLVIIYVILIFLTLWFASIVPDKSVKYLSIFLSFLLIITIWGIIELKPFGYYLTLLFFGLLSFNSVVIVLTGGYEYFYNNLFQGSHFIRGPFQFLFSAFNIYYFLQRKHLFINNKRD